MRRDLDGVSAAHDRLLRRLTQVYDTEPDVLRPERTSLLPGWTVGHVLTHLARNADSHVDMLAGRPQYPDAAHRDTAIAHGARRPTDELLADLASSVADLAQAWASHDSWDHSVWTASGPRPAAQTPLLRWREVEWHTVDLDIGVDPADIDQSYLRVELRLQEMIWRSRRTIGLTPLPAELLAEPPYRRTAWFLGRYNPPHLDHLSVVSFSPT